MIKSSSSSSREELLSEVAIGKAIITLATPMILAGMVTVLYSFIDRFYLGLLNYKAIAVAGVVFPFMMAIFAVGFGIGIATSLIIPRKLGAQKRDVVKEVSNTGAFYSIIATEILAIIAVFNLDKLLVMIGTTQEIYDYTRDFLLVFLIIAPFMICQMLIPSLLRAEGITRPSLYASLISTGINIVLQPILLFVFQVGVIGVALSNAVAAVITTGYLLYVIYKSNCIQKPNIFKPSKKWAIHKEILSMSIPFISRSLISSLALIVVNLVAKQYGTIVLAAVGVDFVISGLYFVFFAGLADAASPIIGYSWGANNFTRLREALFKTMKYEFIIGAIVGLFIFTFSTPLAAIFLHSSQEALDFASKALKIVAFTPLVFGYILSFSSLINAIGYYFQSFVFIILRQGVIYISAILIFASLFGAYGIFYAYIAREIITIIIINIYVHKNKVLRNIYYGKGSLNNTKESSI